MTIGIGFKFADGIMLGADSQVTHGDIFKTAGSKIAYSALKNTKYTLAIAGAGHLEFMEHFFQAATASLDKSDKTTKTAKSIIQNVLRSLYLDHIFPYKTQVSTDGDIALLIAFRGADETLGLWKTTSTAVRDVADDDCESVGSGSYAADFFAGSMYRPNMPKEEALVVAAGILGHVKRFDPYSSGDSVIYAVLTDGRLAREQVKPIARIENYLKQCEGAALDTIIKCANPRLPEQQINDNVEEFSTRLKEFRQELEAPIQKALRGLFGPDVVRVS